LAIIQPNQFSKADPRKKFSKNETFGQQCLGEIKLKNGRGN
jgi:hypothetical protein